MQLLFDFCIKHPNRRHSPKRSRCTDRQCRAPMPQNPDIPSSPTPKRTSAKKNRALSESTRFTLGNIASPYCCNFVLITNSCVPVSSSTEICMSADCVTGVYSSMWSV